MECPSCNARIVDEDALFCPRCGARLPSAEVAATSKLETDPDDSSTSELDLEQPHEPAGPPPEREVATARAPNGDTVVETSDREEHDQASSGKPRRVGASVVELSDSLRRSFASGGWPDACVNAAFVFLFVVGVGAVLLAALKLDAPALGAGASTIGVLSVLVMLGLASLGAWVHIGDLALGSLPLGALVLTGWVIAWTAARSVRKREALGTRARMIEGAKLGVPLAFYCLVAALLFQIRDGATPVSVDAAHSFALGLFWGVLFGAIGGARAHASPRAAARAPLDRLKAARRSVYEGLVTAGIMLATTGLLGVIAILLWIIVTLVRGEPAGNLTLGDTLAGLVYLLAFLPNLVGLVAAFALGAPVEIGARVSFSGNEVGSFESFSLFGWMGSSPGVLSALLVLIPIAACLLGGFSARRNARDDKDGVEVLGSAASFYALALALLAWFGSVRLGAGVAGRGVGRLAPDAGLVLAFGVLWAGLFGWVGWKLGRPQGSGER